AEISFAVPQAGLVAILGASGSGKTTLLRLIAGFERPDAGQIALNGETIASPAMSKKPEQRGVGYVSQEGALFPHLCVADNITFGLPRAQRRARHRVAELLQLVDLPGSYADRPPQSLSGGEQQRVALARALAPAPSLILLDEPFSALDAVLRAETRSAAAEALRRAGTTAILVTHDQEEALSMGAMVGVLQNGRLAQMSTPEFLYRHPVSPALANFVGDAIFTPGMAGDGVVHCALGRLRLAADMPSGTVEVMIRPEQIKIHTSPGDGGVPAIIQDVVFYGHDAVIRMKIASQSADPIISARIFSHDLPRPGADVWLHVEGDVVTFANAPRTLIP
ncbi:MAG: ABC transporter ATP-binding protein, partial [Acidocella sp.]|nr:ABC transporter ATP-binding protein [Acidocella sp.]